MSARSGVEVASKARTSRAPAISPARVLGALPLIGWASLFWFLLFTGRTPLYLGARTQWLVGVGAAILTAAALGRLASLRETSPARVTAGRAWGTALLLVPVVLVTSLPPALLTSYAVGRRSTVSSGGISSSGDIGKGDLTLVDVASALASRPTMKALVQRAGSTESFKGFVDMVPGESADEFELTRFVVTCCVADAIAAQVRVVGAAPGTFHPDQWVRVTGTIYPLGQQIILVADKVVGVTKPSRPYLYP